MTFNSRAPLVSFLVPCYRLGHLLAECVNSILAQRFRDFELLILDNCSPDNTRAVAESFRDPRIQYIRNDANIGHLRNFNNGIGLSRGRYVWLISADDSLANPTALERYVSLMEAHPQVGFTFSRALMVTGASDARLLDWSDCGNRDRIFEPPSLLHRLVQFNCIVMSSVMVRRSCYELAGRFPIDLPHAADWYLWTRLAFHFSAAYLSEPSIRFRVHEDSLTSSLERDDPDVFLSDILSVLWDVHERTGARSLSRVRSTCRRTIAKRVASAIVDEAPTDRVRGTTGAQIELEARRRLVDPRALREFWAEVDLARGDELFWRHDLAGARAAYRSGLEALPLSLEAWVKYATALAGGLGLSLRRVARSLRSSLTSATLLR